VRPVIVAFARFSLTGFQQASFALIGLTLRMNVAGHVQHSPPFLGSENEPDGHEVDGAGPTSRAGRPKSAHPTLSR
jgi:hypothetical protein